MLTDQTYIHFIYSLLDRQREPQRWKRVDGTGADLQTGRHRHRRNCVIGSNQKHHGNVTSFRSSRRLHHTPGRSPASESWLLWMACQKTRWREMWAKNRTSLHDRLADWSDSFFISKREYHVYNKSQCQSVSESSEYFTFQSSLESRYLGIGIYLCIEENSQNNICIYIQL